MLLYLQIFYSCFIMYHVLYQSILALTRSRELYFFVVLIRFWGVFIEEIRRFTQHSYYLALIYVRLYRTYPTYLLESLEQLENNGESNCRAMEDCADAQSAKLQLSRDAS